MSATEPQGTVGLRSCVTVTAAIVLATALTVLGGKHFLGADVPGAQGLRGPAVCAANGAAVTPLESNRSALVARAKWSDGLLMALDRFNNQPASARTKHAPYNLLGPVGPRCSQVVKFGNGDQEKRACAPFYRDGSGSAGGGSSRPVCHIISIGSKNEWDFEKEVLAHTPCDVSTWDCTGHTRDGGSEFQVPEGLRGRVRFFDTCIGTNDVYRPDGTPELLSWPSLLALAEVSVAPSYMKMDIEGFEYEVLHSIVSSATLLPEQVALELHYRTFGKLTWEKNFGVGNGLGWGMAEREKQPAEIAYFMDFLWRRGRYVVANRRDNAFCGTCTEILLARADECHVADALNEQR